MERLYTKNVELLASTVDRERGQSFVASEALRLAGISMDFSRVERKPRYADGRRESDVEHSFMLSLVASELAESLYPGLLDVGLVHQYGGVHDLIELRTDDVATFNLSAEELAKKEQNEHAELEGLLEYLPPHTSQMLRRYEAQQDLESRFVRAVDKLLPVLVDILGDGRRVMQEDYGVTDSDKLSADHAKLHARIAERFSEFPDLVSAHRLLCDMFELEFAGAN